MNLEGKATAESVVRGKINSVETLVVSAYAVAVKNGFEGTEEEWLKSLKGEKGEPGADGKDGVDGAPGVSPTIEKAEGFQFSEDYNEPNTYTYGTVTTIKPDSYSGININDGAIQVAPATESDIYNQVTMPDDDYGLNAPIVPKTVNYAVKMGLTHNHLTFTDEEKYKARELIGAATVDIQGSVSTLGAKVDYLTSAQFKPYNDTDDILTEASLVGDGELYVLWVGADKTMFDYGTAITMLGSCELVRFTVVNGAITGMNRVGKTTVTVDPSLDGDSTNPVQNKAICQTLNDYSVRISGLQENVGDVAAALDEILTMQEALIGGGVVDNEIDITDQLVNGLYYTGDHVPTETGYHKSVVLNLSPGEYTLRFNREMRIERAYINGVWFDGADNPNMDIITEFTFEVTEENTSTYFSFGVCNGSDGLIEWQDGLSVTITLIGGVV